jgi:hypothetical protein
VISLGTPASAGTTWRFRNAVGVIQDHPRVGGDLSNSLAKAIALGTQSARQPLEGVIRT